jgi:hypothetical protein
VQRHRASGLGGATPSEIDMSLSSSRLVSLFALCSVTAFAGSALAVSADAPPAKGKSEPATAKIQARSAKQGKIDRPTLPEGRDSRIVEELMAAKDTPWLVARPASNGGGGDGGVAGQCTPVVSTHTNASFEGGQFIAQAGFAEQEIAAASYTLTAADFPLRVDLCEMIFATSNATVTTTTKWSVIVWEGTPATGSIKYIFSSNGVDLPHLVMQPGTNGTNIQFGIDPNDPDQIVIQNDGSNTFSVGYRIDDHNLQTQDPCVVAPPSSANAFPTTDVGGLQNPTKNWLFLLNCGAFGCPAGWKNFSQLPTLCRPTGDWVMRVTWTPYSCQTPGACCLPNGSCQVLNESTCLAQAGSFIGPGTTCTASTCSAALAPCCFASTGGCLTLTPANCAAAGGVSGPSGQTCSGYVCFPIGACCLPNGSCVSGVSPAACTAQGGVFQGNGTTCTAGLCPEPTGAACFANGFCLVLTQAQAAAAGASWQGAGTTCVDANGNGNADICENARPEDLNGDGVVNAQDLAILLGAWGTNNAAADINDDGTVNAQDLARLLSAWS